MKKNISLLLLLVALVCACSPVLGAGLQAEQSEDKLTYYFTWKNCTFAAGLQDLYTRFGKSSVAMLMGNERWQQTGTLQPFKCFPEEMPSVLAHEILRDTTPIGTTTAIYPFRLAEQDDIAKLVQAQFVASLTTEQLDLHKASEGIPFQSLTPEQQKQVTYLATVCRTVGGKYPEPVFTQKIQQSKVMLVLQPCVSYGFNCSTGSVGSSVSCGSKASAAMWKQWAPGQQEAWKLSKAAQTEPGDDAPGTAAVAKMNGVYTVSTLLGTINEGLTIPATCDPGFSKLRVAVYGSLTHAALAPACAIATGGDWKKTGSQWKLKTSLLAEMAMKYDLNSMIKTAAEIKTYKPKLMAIMQRGKLKVVADPEWSDPELVKTTVQCGAVDISSLKPEQLKYLNDDYEKARKNLPADSPASLSLVKDIKWSPAMDLYVSAGSAILYHYPVPYK